ncbi:MAG: lysophospholipid acyltransferase family protein [Acidiphilium sp.]|nr:lysophospholipid acyltransferase family protein [Acidiphilium sp.]MDD4936589.1 lysophospholipid acyltransferase family protein [Acidiphilium sp.]
MFLIGSLLFHGFIMISAVTAGIIALGLNRLAPGRLLPFGQAWARLALGMLRAFCGINVVVEGMENLPPGGVILAAQHQSAFDTLIWFTLLDKPSYVMKQELRRLPIIGGLLVPAGQIAIDRAGGARALRDLIEQVRAAGAAGRQIIIFPEGTRVAPGARVKLQPGIVAIARATGLPVVPVATNSGRYWPRDAIRKRPGTIKIRVFPPLAASLDRAAMLAALEACFYERGVCG